MEIRSHRALSIGIVFLLMLLVNPDFSIKALKSWAAY